MADVQLETSDYHSDEKGVVCIVVPCYNEEESLPSFFQSMTDLNEQYLLPRGYCLRLVLVDDGSSDSSLELIRSFIDSSEANHYLSFTRNFGKEAGLYAGMEYALELYPGESTLFGLIDVDLQDPPYLIDEMLNILSSDSSVDVAAAYRTTRSGESKLKSYCSELFYKLMNAVSEVKMKSGARDFRLMRRRVVESVVSLPERVRFSKGLLMWGGFSTSWIPYENIERSSGSSKWNFFSLVRYALDGVVAFSVFPLELMSIGGIVIFVLSLFFLLFIIIRALLFGDPVAGWPSLVCIITLLSGIQLLGMGTLGMYLSKMYAELKRRPLFVIKERR